MAEDPSRLARALQYLRDLPAQIGQDTESYLTERGVDPAIAAANARFVRSSAERPADVADLLIPQSMTDVGLGMAAGPFGRGAKALAAGLMAIDPSDAEAGVVGKGKSIGKAVIDDMSGKPQPNLATPIDPPKPYSINATGDAVVGDEVEFKRAIFTGSFRSPTFAGHETVRGKIIKDSYGADKQQHTFTLVDDAGKEFRIKGRNLYREGLARRPWSDEAARGIAADEKHTRGDSARAVRAMRKETGW